MKNIGYVYLGIPPASRRGWPGTHTVEVDHLGGGGWHTLVLSFADGRYVLQPTPWQLIYWAWALIVSRVLRGVSSVRTRVTYLIARTSAACFARCRALWLYTFNPHVRAARKAVAEKTL